MCFFWKKKEKKRKNTFDAFSNGVSLLTLTTTEAPFSTKLFTFSKSPFLDYFWKEILDLEIGTKTKKQKEQKKTFANVINCWDSSGEEERFSSFQK